MAMVGVDASSLQVNPQLTSVHLV